LGTAPDLAWKRIKRGIYRAKSTGDVTIFHHVSALELPQTVAVERKMEAEDGRPLAELEQAAIRISDEDNVQPD